MLCKFWAKITRGIVAFAFGLLLSRIPGKKAWATFLENVSSWGREKPWSVKDLEEREQDI